jgi:Mrp family chromosome partitioning ATPase
VLEAPETATLGTTVDTTVLVIQAARTKRGVVQRAMDVFAKAGAPVLGAVLNRRRHDIPEFIYRRL